jgi:hypothetical protein
MTKACLAAFLLFLAARFESGAGEEGGGENGTSASLAESTHVDAAEIDIPKYDMEIVFSSDSDYCQYSVEIRQEKHMYSRGCSLLNCSWVGVSVFSLPATA